MCFAGIRVANRAMPTSALDELGLKAPPAVGIAVAFLLSIPMLATFAITSTTNPHVEAVPLLMTAIVSPVGEEVLFRGYLFLQLYRRDSGVASEGHHNRLTHPEYRSCRLESRVRRVVTHSREVENGCVVEEEVRRE
jgi:hypothetical protein